MSIPWRIQTYDSVTSTQDIARGMAGGGAAEGLVIHAVQQTGGRGRHGREWDSPPGNLYLSALLRPNCQARLIGQLGLAAGLAVYKTLKRYLPRDVDLRIKWPNDVLAAERKCAGILLESNILPGGTVDWLVVGVGINLAYAPDFAVCLDTLTPKALNKARLRTALLKNIDRYYALWNREPFEVIRQEWMECSYPPGTAVQVRTGERLELGLFHGIDGAGNLLLGDEQLRARKITAGEVHFQTEI